MKTLDVAVVAMLLGAVAAPIGARAAIQSPGRHVVATDTAAAQPPAGSRGATSPRGYLLVQYGGDGDDDPPSNGGGQDRDDDYEDDRPSRGNSGGGFPRNSGGGGPGLGNILNGIGTIIREGQRNQQRQQQQQQQQRIYNDQAARERALRNQLANERKKQQAAEKRLRDQQRRQAEEQKRIQRQNDKRRNDNAGQPNPAPYVPPAVIPPPVPVGNDPNPVPPDDNCPDNFQQLRVGATTLYPYRTDYPADPRVCAGTTRNGCYLRVMSGPPACGSKPTCVMHCPPNVPILVPQPVPPPRPLPQACANPPCTPNPPPVACAYPPCTPNPPPVPCAYPPCTPNTPQVCQNPPCGPQPVPVIPDEPAVETHLVTPVIEKDRPTTPAVTTHLVTPTVEPDRPTTPAVTTHLVTPTVEPDRPTTPAVTTHLVMPTVEPDQPTTPAVPTHIVTPSDEPDHPTTPAILTHLVRPETDPASPKPARPPLSEFKPYPKDKPRIEPTPPADFGFDDAAGPVCTPQGGPAVPQLKLDPQIVRTIETTALAAIPVVGGPLSALAKALWKDTTSDSLFDQMKNYVNTVVPELLAKEFGDSLERKVRGIQRVLRNYEEETDPVDKAEDLNFLRNAHDTFEPDFTDETHPPDRTIAHFAAFGALKLAVLKERLDRARPQQRAVRQKDLDDAIKLYRDHAKSLKDKLAEKRIAGLKVTSHCTSSRIFRHSHTTCHYTADDPACRWSSDRRDSEADANGDLGARRAAVAKAYSDTLDTVLAPLTAMASALASHSSPAASGPEKQ
jgi:hypothetical protein